MNLRISPFISSSAHYLLNVPQKWVNDIKHLEFNEILGSSVGILAMITAGINLKRKNLSKLLAVL